MSDNVINLKAEPEVHYLHDGRHGYFKISHTDLKRMGGKETMFTPFSFKDGSHFYIEYKSDVNVLLDLFKDKQLDLADHITRRREIPLRWLDTFERMNLEKYAEKHPSMFDWE